MVHQNPSCLCSCRCPGSLRLFTETGAVCSTAHLIRCVTCRQVGTATSTTTPWADSSATPSCMKSAPARAKFADSSLDDPLTPCTNDPTAGRSAKLPTFVFLPWMNSSYSHLAPYFVGSVAAVKMISHVVITWSDSSALTSLVSRLKTRCIMM